MKHFLRILLALVLLLGLAIGGFKMYDWIAYNDFYSNAEVAFPTPGANDGFVQQGFDYLPEERDFLVTGYMADGTESRVYRLCRRGIELSMTKLLTEEGEPYTKHTGGIVRNGEYVYITNDEGGLDVFAYSDIEAGAETTKKIGWIPTYNVPAYCYIYDGYLFTGSFFIEEDYETPAYERMMTPNGEQNYSLMTVFKLDETKEFGVDSTPKALISTTRCVQGMCITDDGKIVLSTSYGLSASQLFIYDTTNLPKKGDYTFTDGETFTFEGLPLYYLDNASTNLVETVKAPPMAEELVYLDGKIYIMNESACNKYIFGKFTTGYNVYAYKYAEQFAE
ncbi:MAG: hypothetical protein IJW96_05095 [Clostridia bacterium]|nr:hypothetical protein [Clostridia bacterium]